MRSAAMPSSCRRSLNGSARLFIAVDRAPEPFHLGAPSLALEAPSLFRSRDPGRLARLAGPERLLHQRHDAGGPRRGVGARAPAPGPAQPDPPPGVEPVGEPLPEQFPLGLGE